MSSAFNFQDLSDDCKCSYSTRRQRVPLTLLTSVNSTVLETSVKSHNDEALKICVGRVQTKTDDITLEEGGLVHSKHLEQKT